MFLPNLEEASIDLHEYLQNLLNEIKGFLYIGEVPVGTRVENLVWITTIDDSLRAELPTSVIELPEIWTDSLGTDKLINGVDFSVLEDGKTVIFTAKKDSFRSIGNNYVFYIPYLRARGSNLWETFGKRLVDLYREDSEHYRFVLQAVLEYFIFGPTKTGTENLFERPTGVDIRVDDYISKPNWWVSKVLPEWMVESLDWLPVVGDDLIVGEFIVPDDSDIALQLRRTCFPSESIEFGQYPIRFGGKEYNGKYYFYGGKSLGCIYMDDIGKYHTFIVEGDWEAFSTLTSDFELWKSFYRSLFEGKLTSSYPLIYVNKDLYDQLVFSTQVGDLIDLEINIYVYDDFTDGFSYGDHGLYYGLDKYYHFLFKEFSHPFKKYFTKMYYTGQANLNYDGSVVYGFNDSWQDIYVNPTADYTRILFFNDPGVVFGGENISYGALSPSNIIIRPPFNYGENNIALDYAEIYRFAVTEDIYLFAVNDAYDIKKVYVVEDITGWVPVQSDFYLEVQIYLGDLIREITHRFPLFTFYFRFFDAVEPSDYNRYFIFVFWDTYQFSNSIDTSQIIKVYIYTDSYGIASSAESFEYQKQDRSITLFEGTSLAFREMFGVETVDGTSQSFMLF